MSSVTTHATEVLYFGKLPSRGDFVRSAHHASVIQSLDQWQAQAMERLSTDPRWKLVYDQAPAVQFAILGLHSQVGLAGHWLASQDASGRRFPFITAGVFDVTDQIDFIQHGPLVLARLWARLEQVARVAHAATDLAHAQASLTTPIEGALKTSGPRLELVDFLETHTVASLEQMLAASGARVSVRQTLLALGTLLQPVMAQGAGKLHKGLRLPLPSDAGLRWPVACFWLSLILGFFKRVDAELALFVTTHGTHPELILCFQGASAASLCSVIDPEALLRDTVEVTQADWVEDCLEDDYGLRKLSNYLCDPALSLAQALRTFEEIFLGV
ncbi:type VI secretion system-associated protein TagF [Aquabacterium sp.]|uniref:type VI secretion system-associated protein TagF n=1 Tax=Aquabacterium sp. TaxID=1872578 RepID=UPI0024896D8B|nr:type VI secretion system-associated protein TagF [Aquabacterium sp.]MDI1259668.1 type VI secretion system-associated protein TagF [Aquabacterium sp.]